MSNLKDQTLTSIYLSRRWVARKFINARNQIAYTTVYNKYKPYTMIPKSVFTQNLDLIKQYNRTPGDVVECGVWKGGMIAAISEIRNSKNTTYHLFDSFEGLPIAKEVDGEAAIKWQSNKNSPLYFDNCKANETDAIAAMKLSGVKNYRVYKGWFEDTLKSFKPKRKISILRLDGDWYESTMTCLVYLVPHMSRKGLIILDDYYTWDGCAKALHDYLSSNKLPYRIRAHNNTVAYISLKQIRSHL